MFKLEYEEMNVTINRLTNYEISSNTEQQLKFKTIVLHARYEQSHDTSVIPLIEEKHFYTIKLQGAKLIRFLFLCKYT